MSQGSPQALSPTPVSVGADGRWRLSLPTWSPSFYDDRIVTLKDEAISLSLPRPRGLCALSRPSLSG